MIRSPCSRSCDLLFQLDRLPEVSHDANGDGTSTDVMPDASPGGYGNTHDIGDDELPASASDVLAF